MSVDWHQHAIQQLHFHWRSQLRPRLEGLTDDEYFWEPAPGCWTIRAQDDGRFTPDVADPEPVPPPVTTIAWRLGHVGWVLHRRVDQHFGDDALDGGTIDLPRTAGDALAWVDDGYSKWMGGVRGLDEEDLARPIGPTGGPFGELPFAVMVLHVNREVIHHGAEVALLRDLYRARLHLD